MPQKSWMISIKLDMRWKAEINKSCIKGKLDKIELSDTDLPALSGVSGCQFARVF